MQSSRLIPAIVLAAASTLSAQLPPSVLNPNRPAQPIVPATAAPVAPIAPVTPAPMTPPPAPAPEPTVAPSEEPSPATIDFGNTVPNTLSPEEIAQGWKLLFDGKRLIGMRGVQRNDPLAAGWKIASGELTLPKDIKQMDNLTGGDLATVEQFWDFEFRFEWKATVSANSGIRYLVNMAMGQAPSGLEYQIIDDVHNTISLKGGLLRRSGALDNVLPVGPNASLRVADPLNRQGDPWNEGRIVVQGNKAEHWLNGEKVLEFALGPQLRTAADKNYKRDEPFASRPHGMFGTKAKTPIVIVDQGTEVSFRNLKVRPLVPKAATPVAPGAAPAASGAAQSGGNPNPLLLPPKR